MTAACRGCGADLLLPHETVAGQCVECMFMAFLEGEDED